MESNESIHKAGRDGDSSMLRELLEIRNDYPLQDHDAQHPIFHAISNGHVDCVEEFIKAAISNGDNPLRVWPCKWRNLVTYATAGGHFDSVKLLFNICDSHILCLSFEEKNEMLVESVRFPKILVFLLNQLLWCVDHVGPRYGLLISAADKDCIESMKILIARRIDVNRQLSLYSSNEKITQLEVIKKLMLEVGYGIKSFNLVEIVWHKDTSEDMIIDIFKFLIEHGADVHTCIPCPQCRFRPHEGVRLSPLFASMFYGRLKVLKYLLTVTSQVKLGQSKATSPVLAAVQYRQLNCLKELLDAGYSIDGRLEGCEECYPPNLCGKNLMKSFDLIYGEMNIENILGLFDILMKEDVQSTFLKINEFECLLHDVTPDFAKVIRRLVQLGIIEHFFGRGSGLQAFWEFIADICATDYEELEEGDQSLVVDNIRVLLNYLSLFDISATEDYYLADLEPTVLPLMQICRRTVRCCVYQRNLNLLPIKDLELPIPLLDYLMFKNDM